MNCTDDGRFYCENGIPLFVRRRQVSLLFLESVIKPELPLKMWDLALRFSCM